MNQLREKAKPTAGRDGAILLIMYHECFSLKDPLLLGTAMCIVEYLAASLASGHKILVSFL